MASIFLTLYCLFTYLMDRLPIKVNLIITVLSFSIQPYICRTTNNIIIELIPGLVHLNSFLVLVFYYLMGATSVSCTLTISNSTPP